MRWRQERTELLVRIDGNWVSVQEGTQVLAQMRLGPDSSADMITAGISMLTMILLERIVGPDAEARGLAKLLADLANG